MTDTPPRRSPPLALIPLALLFFGFMFSGRLLDPPPLRTEAQGGQFDATGAHERIARVLGDEAPHPVDSAAQDVVRDALLREITALGFQPEMRDTFACRPQPRGPLVDCARVRNIVFSMGPADGPAILAAAHYDSVPAAPGASDDGIGLAVWLEVARLMRGEQLTRRVVFLFSDGEEPALLGAYAFAEGDPLMQSVQALVNLEARGSRGTAIFFESNQPNADAVAAFASAPRGVANSVAADVYALLSNSSDVTALTRPGLDVLNISLLDGLEDYHTPQDTLASQDPRSVQHMGDIALAVTRNLAGAPDRGGTTPMVYTDIASYAFISMQSWAAQVGLGLCTLVAFFVFWRAGAAGRWRAFAAPLVAIVFAGLLAAAAGFSLGVIRPGAAYGFAFPEPTRAWCILAALLGGVLALRAVRAPRNTELTGAAGVFWFGLIGFASSFFLSGISILYVIPAAAFAVFALISFIWKPALAIGAVLAMLLAVLVWAPTLYLTELALGFEFPFATAILFAIPSLVWLGALVRAQGNARWRGAAVGLGVVAIACVAASAVVPSASAARPQPLNINYFLNIEGNEARITAGAAARALPREVADAFDAETLLPGDRLETWVAPAQAVTFPSPTLEELSVTREGGERVVRGRLRMNGAYRVLVRMPNEALPLRAVVNGASADFAETGGTGDYMNLACQGRACEGVEIAIHLDAVGEAGDWYLIGQFPGAAVPAEVQAMRARRPASATPIQLGDGAVTLSRLRPFG